MSILDDLRLPQRERVIFERNTLVACICQVQFASILDIADRASIAPFQRAIRRDYPLLEQPVGVVLDIRPGGSVQQQAGPLQWRFSDLDGMWTVVMSQDSLTIETHDYERSEDFLTRIRFLLETFHKHFTPIVGRRVGLRYVNEIREGLDNLPEIINPILLGPLGDSAIKERAKHAIQQVLLTFPENQNIALQHGLMPDGSAVQTRENEQPKTGPFYLLDFDVSCSVGGTGVRALPVDPDSVCSRVEEYNQVIYRLYRWCITDSFASTLGVRHDGQ